MYIARSILILSFALSSMVVVAQSNEPEKSDSTKMEFNWMPTSIRFGVDAVGLTNTFTRKYYQELEFATDIRIDRFLVDFEYGLLDRSLGSDSLEYQTTGQFFRIGVDGNILYKDPDGNAFFIGLRYCRGTSNHTLNYIYEDPLFTGVRTDEVELNGLNSRWFELVSGVRVKVLWEVWLGFTGRLKFAHKTDDSLVLQPYIVPGYGFTSRRAMWELDYYIMYRIPFGKK